MTVAVTDAHREMLAKKPVPAYATIIPTRTTKPVVSLHNSLSHAKNAVQAQGYGYVSKRGYRIPECEIYALVDGGWELLHRIEAGTFNSELPWKR